MIAKFSDFYKGEVFPAMVDEPLFDAMAAGIKELQVTREEFKVIMRYALYSGVYHHVYYDGGDYPTVLGMKLTLI